MDTQQPIFLLSNPFTFGALLSWFCEQISWFAEGKTPVHLRMGVFDSPAPQRAKRTIA